MDLVQPSALPIPMFTGVLLMLAVGGLTLTFAGRRIAAKDPTERGQRTARILYFAGALDWLLALGFVLWQTLSAPVL
jgi:hypothetical protein